MHFSNLILLCIGLAGSSSATIQPPASQVVLPKPNGPYQVGLSTAELIDHTRTQAFAPTTQPISLMISLFYPISIPATPYMTPSTALFEDINLSSYNLSSPNGTFAKLALQLIPHPSHSHKQKQKQAQEQERSTYPLVLFMPAQGTTRLFYSLLASNIASLGYTVATIDAPYDFDIVQYPSGPPIYENDTIWANPSPQIAYTAIQTRAQDALFVLDALANDTLAHELVPGLPGKGLDTSYVAMFGHSLGGATAFSVLGDERVVGGWILMGRWSKGHTLDLPALMWGDGWRNLTEWKRAIVVNGTRHYDFSDWPMVFEALGIMPTDERVREGLSLGSINCTRAMEIVTSYVGAFLGFVLRGERSELLDGPSKRFPEVGIES